MLNLNDTLPIAVRRDRQRDVGQRHLMQSERSLRALAMKHCRSLLSRWTVVHRILAAALLLSLSGSPLTRAMAAPTDDPATLIRMLNHGNLAVRDAAVDGLLACGLPALPAIEQALPTATGEAAFRLPLIAEAIAVTATERMLALQPADPTAPATAADPFSMAVQRIDRLGTSGHRLLLRLRWRPPLAPVLLRLPLASVVAEGSAGEAVPLPSRRGVVEPLLTAGTCWVDLPLRLGPSPPGLTMLASLRGTVECWLPGAEHRFLLPLQRHGTNLPTSPGGPGSRRSLAGLSVQCIGWTTAPSGPASTSCRVELAAEIAEPSEAFASHRSWLADRQPELLLPTGEVVAGTSHRVVSRSRRGLSVATRFELSSKQLPRGTQVAWRLPLGVRQVPVDFWLRAVRLSEPVDGEN